MAVVCVVREFVLERGRIKEKRRGKNSEWLKYEHFKKKRKNVKWTMMKDEEKSTMENR